MTVLDKTVLVRPEDKLPSNGPSASDSEDQSQLTATAIGVKFPKRILHFCDGVLEEYSSDEEVTQEEQSVLEQSPSTWGPWMWNKAWLAGLSTLSAVDCVGELLASLFGITTPRYYFELQEYSRREEHKLKQQEEEQGWSQQASGSVSMPLTNENRPSSVNV